MRILIQNVHSAQNLGDHGIMLGTLTGLRKIYPQAKITVAANDPDSWHFFSEISIVATLCSWVADCKLGRWQGSLVRTPYYLLVLSLSALGYRFFGIKWLPTNHSKRCLLQAYYEADLVLSSGGGNFYAERSISPSFFWNLVSLAFPLALGKKIIMLPQSVGPVQGPILIWLSRFILRRVTFVVVRESVSLAFIREKIGRQHQIKLLPDLAFSMPSHHSKTLNLPEITDNSQTVRIGVTLIDRGAQLKEFSGQSLYEDAVVQAFSKLCELFKVTFYIFVQSYGPAASQNDTDVSSRVYNRLQGLVPQVYLIDNLTDSLSAKELYSRMDGMVATRMHTSIFALTNNVPAISIGYQPKSKGMVDFFGMEHYFCDIRNITSASLFTLLCELIENKEALVKHLEERNNLIRPSISEWTQLILNS